MRPRRHAEGDRFGRLVNISPYSSRKGKQWQHLMLCDCGAKKDIAGGDLRSGHTSSCGCLRLEKITTHGMVNSKEYRVWSEMVQRCTTPSCKSFKDYGGRGVEITESWMEFGSFIKDMGLKPYGEASIERIDNDKGYSKDNCKWASRFEQNINQRLRSDNKTGYKGVFYRKGAKTYYASISRYNKRIHLGCFKHIDEAIAARLEAESKHYGKEGLM